MSIQLWDDDSAEGSLWSRSFDFDGDGDADCFSTKKTVSLLVEEEWNAGIGGTCWEGGVLLARFLNSPAFASLEGLPRGRPLRAIELGSGVSALPCLIAARLTRRGGEGGKGGGGDEGEEEAGRDGGDIGESGEPSALPLFSEIFATDIDECLPGLEANARKNVPSHTSAEVVKWGGEGEGEEEEETTTTATTTTEKPQALKLLDLDWRLFPQAAPFLRAPFDVVLVADAVYISSLKPALVEAMRSVSSEESVVLLGYYKRSESADAQFWPRLRAVFEVEPVPAASFGCAGADKGENRGLFRLRKRSEGEYEEAENRRRVEEEEEKEGKEEEHHSEKERK